MYHKAYGIIETLAPLHVGASAGEETGNLNLIFRDQFTQTGIIPGSSIRGRFRADMRLSDRPDMTASQTKALTNVWYGHDSEADEIEEESLSTTANSERDNETVKGEMPEPPIIRPTESSVDKPEAAPAKGSTPADTTKDRTTEALVKFEYASLVWLPVFCPGQPIVWVTCPRLLKRYQQITGGPVVENGDQKGTLAEIPSPSNGKHPVALKEKRDRLFFNLGFLDNLEEKKELAKWVPTGTRVNPDNLVVVNDADISLIHDMALYRQTRTKLKETEKKVDNFFGFEAIPEDSLFVFPVAIRKKLPAKAQEILKHLKQPEVWQPFVNGQKQPQHNRELYFGGLESIGCGRCRVNLAGEYVSTFWKQEG
jgi:CRISPR-associated protein Cmr4